MRIGFFSVLIELKTDAYGIFFCAHRFFHAAAAVNCKFSSKKHTQFVYYIGSINEGDTFFPVQLKLEAIHSCAHFGAYWLVLIALHRAMPYAIALRPLAFMKVRLMLKIKPIILIKKITVQTINPRLSVTETRGVEWCNMRFDQYSEAETVSKQWKKDQMMFLSKK